MKGASLDITMAIERRPSSGVNVDLDWAENIQFDGPM